MKKKLQLPAIICTLTGAAIILYKVFSESEVQNSLRSVGYLLFFTGLTLAFTSGMFNTKNQPSK